MFRVDESKLNGKIVECGTTKDAIASEIGIDRCTFYRRIKTNKLLISDMHKICDILNLSSAEAVDIFLAQ